MPPIPDEAITALAWIVVADVLLVSAFAAGYAARVVRSWHRRDE